MNKIYKLILSTNREDLEIAKMLLEKDPETAKKLLKIAKYLGPRYRKNTDDEFYEDFGKDIIESRNLYFSVHKLGLIDKDPNETFGKGWTRLGNLTSRGKYYKSAIKALRELRQ